MSELRFDGEYLFVDHGYPCCPHRYRVVEDDDYMRRVELRENVDRVASDQAHTPIYRDCPDEK